MNPVWQGMLLSLFLAASAIAHEGHDHGAPGAIPFAPHGGKAAEAAPVGKNEHEHADDHDHEEEEGHDHGSEDSHDHAKEADHDAPSAGTKKASSLEYFFEATYLQGKLAVFPLALDASNLKEFILVKPEGNIKDLRVNVEFPRSRKTESIRMELVRDEKLGDHWIGQVPANKDIRFYAHIQANWLGAERKAKIHLEKRK